MTSRTVGSSQMQGASMGNESEPRIGTILILAGSESIALALATARSVNASGVSAKPVLLATERAAEHCDGFDLVSVTDVLPPGSVAADVLGDDDLLAFAEPFAMEHLLADGGDVVSVAAGSFMVGPADALAAALRDRPLVLTAPAVVPPDDTTVPHLTTARSRPNRVRGGRGSRVGVT